MKDIPDSLPPPTPTRMKMRIVIPLVFIAVVSALLIWGIVRGNWSDAQPRNPFSAADGVMTQLLRTGDDRKQIHASVIVSAPPERVWKVVTDYDHFSDVFPNISASKGVRDPMDAGTSQERFVHLLVAGLWTSMCGMKNRRQDSLLPGMNRTAHGKSIAEAGSLRNMAPVKLCWNTISN